MNKLKDKNILLCITGSVAAYKACDIIRFLRKEEANVQVMISESGEQFIGVSTLAALSNNKVITSLFPNSPKGGLEHVELSFEVDLIIVAPATANILCKSSNGVADDLNSTTLSICEQPTIFVPAMNYRMWQNPATIDAVDKLKKRDKIIVDPEKGQLASLHVGDGRLANLDTIFNTIRKVFEYELLLENKKILITAGPTQEAIDPVRYITNRSSGKMGYALAKVCKDLGASVDLISGPVRLPEIAQINNKKIITADEMLHEITKLMDKNQYDYIFMAAAVCDYKSINENNHKIKSNSEELVLSLMKNPDIIQNISKKSKAVKIGFALETKNGEKEAIKKMSNKNLDYIVLNYANESGAGFDVNTNHVYIYSKDRDMHEISLDRKDRVAKKIIEYII